jgi:hypothetical protein
LNLGKFFSELTIAQAQDPFPLKDISNVYFSKGNFVFFRFLHDIISVLIRDKGIFEGLFTEDEMVSDNVKGKFFFCSFTHATKLNDIFLQLLPRCSISNRQCISILQGYI